MEAAAVTINMIVLGIIVVFCLGVLAGYKLRKSQERTEDERFQT